MKNVCWKCGGTGRLEWARHVANGVCFVCKGAGEYEGSGEHTLEGTTSLSPDGKVVWQFQARARNSEGEVTVLTARGAEPDFVVVQAVEGQGKSGRTLMRGALHPLDARALYRRLAQGERVDAVGLTSSEVGLVEGHQWTFARDGSHVCRWDKNRPGVSWL